MPVATSLIRGVEFTMLLTQGMPKARAFYEGVLGLVPSDPEAERWVEYELPGGILSVLDAKAVGMPFGTNNGGGFAFRVDDVEAAMAQLKAHGIEFPMGLIDSGVCKMAPFHDPDGNSLVLHHRYAPE